MTKPTTGKQVPATSVSEIIEKKKNNQTIQSKQGSRAKDGSKRGGARRGSGRKAGKLSVKQMERLAAKRALVQRVVANTDKLFNAQLDKAIGEKFLMVKITERGPKGGVARVYHEIVTSPQTILDYLDGEVNGNSIDDDDHFYYISTKPADNMAIANMLDRAYGKPTEKVELGGQDEGDLAEISNDELNSRIDRYLAKRRGA